jgi:hypothetical protein
MIAKRKRRIRQQFYYTYLTWLGTNVQMVIYTYTQSDSDARLSVLVRVLVGVAWTVKVGGVAKPNSLASNVGRIVVMVVRPCQQVCAQLMMPRDPPRLPWQIWALLSDTRGFGGRHLLDCPHNDMSAQVGFTSETALSKSSPKSLVPIRAGTSR